MNVLGIIPARGGSKGIPGKNIVPILGKPLLAYTAEAALGSKHLKRVVLSTDDESIANVARAWGVEVPFMRPPELAKDDTPTLPVLQDVVRRLENAGEHYDAICLLQPTSPLRTSKLIDDCIQRFIDQDADSLFTVLRVPPKYNPHWVFETTNEGHLALATGETQIIPRRQDLPLAYCREGSVYLMKRDILMVENSLYGTRMVGFEIDADSTANIDSWDDLHLAEKLLSKETSKDENS